MNNKLTELQEMFLGWLETDPCHRISSTGDKLIAKALAKKGLVVITKTIEHDELHCGLVVVWRVRKSNQN